MVRNVCNLWYVMYFFFFFLNSLLKWQTSIYIGFHAGPLVPSFMYVIIWYVMYGMQCMVCNECNVWFVMYGIYFL